MSERVVLTGGGWSKSVDLEDSQVLPHLTVNVTADLHQVFMA